MSQNKSFRFFLFVNPLSGNNEGREYLTITNKLSLNFESGIKVQISIFNLCDASARQNGFVQIQGCQTSAELQLRVIICGGDGSITWVISQAVSYKLDLSRIVFGILPIGTGNDFSRTLGWGYKPPHFSLGRINNLIRKVQEWIQAKVKQFDIWDVQLTTYANGKIFDIKSQREIQRQSVIFKKMFTNYVGIGLDARVVYTVQQNRTKNALMNKIVYCCVGFCNFFKSMKKLEQVVAGFKQQDKQEKIYTILQEQLPKARIQNSQQRSSVFRSTIQSQQITLELSEIAETSHQQPLNKLLLKQKHDFIIQDEHISQLHYPLREGYRGLVCMNVSSYMAGIRKVWRTKQIAMKDCKKSFVDQKTNDHMVQFVGFKSELNLALQRISRQGAKVAQGKGPFTVFMKDPKGNQEDTFMQVDGESIKVRNLKAVKISHSVMVPEGQIRVMYKQ